MIKMARQLLADKKAATAIEYGLMLGLIALALVASLNGLAGKTAGMWNNVSTEVLSH